MKNYKLNSYLVALFLALFSLIDIAQADQGRDFYWNIRNDTGDELRFSVSTYRRYQLNNTKVTPGQDDGTLSVTLEAHQTSDIPARGVSTQHGVWYNAGTDLELNYWEGKMSRTSDGRYFEFKKYQCDYGSGDSLAASAVVDKATVVISKQNEEYYVSVVRPHTGACPPKILKIKT